MSESVKIDLRLDPGLKETLEDIAVKYFDARTHHKSGRPEITATINRLIKLGIKALEDGHPDTSASYPDGMELVITQKVNEAIANLGIHHYMTEIDLNQKLSPIVYDFKKTTEAITSALAPITEEIESLRKQIEILSTATPPSSSESVELGNLPILKALQKSKPSEDIEVIEPDKAISVGAFSRAELEKKTIRELKNIASKKIKNFSRMTKAELIEELAEL